MRMMPFPQVKDSVTWGIPTTEVNGITRAVTEELPSWDFLTPLVISVPFRVDQDLFLDETDIREAPGAPLLGIDAVLQADCAATGERFIGRTPLSAGAGTQGATVSVTVPAGTASIRLEVSMSVVFAREDEPGRGLAAHLCGSRLHTGPTTYRVQLEGVGDGFPTEAFPFEHAGYPADAAWLLHMDPSHLTDPFMAAVRLFINTSHPRSEELLAGTDASLASVLTMDVLGMLVERASLIGPEAIGDDYSEESVGGVLDHLTNTYLGMGLRATVAEVHRDPATVRSRLQAAIRFLRTEEK